MLEKREKSGFNTRITHATFLLSARLSQSQLPGRLGVSPTPDPAPVCDSSHLL
jgi:hypothetical protein